MDEEAQKRNTDCVYFLASPLTCKKGNSCEFRHSKAARLNPRDCWYWLHKICLNPHCAFRHLPIEGKSVLLPAPQAQGTVTDAPRVPANSVPTDSADKSKTPCYFFSKGNCAKGDSCPYMHVPSLPTNQGTTTQQKSKLPPGDAVQGSSKPVIVLKGDIKKQTVHKSYENSSVSHNEAQPIPPLKSVVMPAKEPPQMQKDLERSRIPESSVTSIASQHEQASNRSRKTRVSKFSDTPGEYRDALDRFQAMNGLAERSERSQQGPPSWKCEQESNQEREKTRRRGVFDLRDRNGRRSEAWGRNEEWVLQGEGSDHSNQREDGQYSPRFDSKGRSRGLDDSAGSGIKPLPAQYGDNHYKHHQEPQMHKQPEYNGLADYPQHLCFPSRSRSSIRDGERMASEGYRNTVDLRNHLKKRQRDDMRGHTSETHFKERPWHDDPFQQEHNGRATYRREVDSRGMKRQRHDGRSPGPDGLSHWSSPMRHRAPGRSPDRVSHLRSPSRQDYVRGEAIDRGREDASREVLACDSRSYVACKGPRSECAKNDSDFTGPKSLAQIKAEKTIERSSAKTDANAKADVCVQPRNSVDARSQEESVSRGKKERAFDHQSLISEDFKGPKPLLLSQKEKEMVEPMVQAQDSTAKPNRAENTREDRQREVEDGEVRDEEDDWNEERGPCTDLPVMPVQKEVALSLPAEENTGQPSGEALNHAQEVEDDDLGSSEDLSRLDDDMGPAISGEEDYELDEEDENFSTRLGGFFS